MGTTMNDVARACGMSKPALYHYVQDKSQLLFEIASTHVARLLTLVDEVNASHAKENLLSIPPPKPRLCKREGAQFD